MAFSAVRGCVVLVSTVLKPAGLMVEYLGRKMGFIHDENAISTVSQ